ncbi:GNAT family N-acetyltransferase [Marisediminicola sp. LYQ134]|uniref:GNAT family N-acetyltransferase n=1 Tax=Marisediminicola sp. LYQ134 TaxID=3391061 RepID=UPI003983C2A9
MPDCSVVAKSWSELTTTELYAFLKLRTDVFFVEQRIDEEELDDRDQEPRTLHFFTADDRGIAAYARVLVDAEPSHRDARHIVGRVVVRQDRRGEGLAKTLVAAALDAVGPVPVVLHAQHYVASLYAGFGFEAEGDIYLEAGMPHVTMYRAALG